MCHSKRVPGPVAVVVMNNRQSIAVEVTGGVASVKFRHRRRSAPAALSPCEADVQNIFAATATRHMPYAYEIERLCDPVVQAEMAQFWARDHDDLRRGPPTRRGHRCTARERPHLLSAPLPLVSHYSPATLCIRTVVPARAGCRTSCSALSIWQSYTGQQSSYSRGRRGVQVCSDCNRNREHDSHGTRRGGSPSFDGTRMQCPISCGYQ